MDEEQQFLFDVNGYIVLEDVSRQRSFALAPYRAAVPRALSLCFFCLRLLRLLPR